MGNTDISKKWGTQSEPQDVGHFSIMSNYFQETTGSNWYPSIFRSTQVEAPNGSLLDLITPYIFLVGDGFDP
jgi:hypothetical protein